MLIIRHRLIDVCAFEALGLLSQGLFFLERRFSDWQSPIVQLLPNRVNRPA